MGAQKLRFAAIATILFLFSVPALGGKPGSVSEVIVVSTIEGSSVLADPAIPNFRLQSDLLGDYHNGVDRVLSHLQAGTIGTGAGDWELDTADSTVRKLTLDLREPYDGNANPPFAYTTLSARIIVKCHVVSPANRGAYPDINDALVTCTEVSGNSADPNAPCTAWTVDPSVTDSTGARNLARLVFRGKGGNIEDRGRYYMRFHISFRK